MNMNLKGIMKSLNAKPGQVVSDPYARAFAPQISEAEGQDHEVHMAQSSLDSIIKNATELKKKIGDMEKDIPAWIQDHITNSDNYIEQANSGYHEYNESTIKEAGDETYVVYIIDDFKKRKVKETNNKTSAIKAVNTLMKSDIEGAGWMTAKAWEKEPMK